MKPEHYAPLEGRRTPLALRKQMLILRAGLQREELAGHVRALRGTGPSQTGWLDAALRPLTLQRFGRLLSLARQYPSWGPVLGSAASWGLSRWRWPAMRHVGLAFSLGWLVWQGWRLVSAHRSAGDDDNKARRTRPDKQPEKQPVTQAPASATLAFFRPKRSAARRAGLDAASATARAALTEQDLAIARRLAALARKLDAQR